MKALLKLICLIKGHKLRLFRKVVGSISEQRCACCGSKFVRQKFADEWQLIPLFPRMEKMNDYIIENRRRDKKPAYPKQVQKGRHRL